MTTDAMTMIQRLGLDSLSVEERLALIDALWDSLGERVDEVPLTKEQEAELDKRIDLYEADPTRGSSWEEVKARIRAAR